MFFPSGKTQMKPGRCAPKGQNMKSTVNFGVIGCGVISHFHIQAINAIEGAKLYGVYDHIYEFAKKIASEQHVKAYQTLEEMLADPELDAVCICTPSGLHAKQAVEAAKAGKHVLIEKPIALSLEDCDAISAEAEKSGVKVAVVSQLRFSPAMQKVKRAINEGRLGKIVSADIYMKYYRSQEYYDKNEWRGTIAMDGGGALMNQGIHGVDLLQYAMGPVKSITALSAALVRKIEVEDTLNAIVEFENGAFGVIQAMTSAYPGFPRRLEINGEHGCIVMEEDTIVKWDVEGEESAEEGKLDDSVKSFSDPSKIGTEGHILQISNFIDAIHDKADLLVDDKEGRKALEIILNAYRSSEEKKTVYFKK